MSTVGAFAASSNSSVSWERLENRYGVSDYGEHLLAFQGTRSIGILVKWFYIDIYWGKAVLSIL